MADLKMRFPGGRKKAVTLSYDDGVEQDARLIEIMKAHGLKGTFNLNSGLYRKPGVVYEEGRIHRPLSKEAASELYTKNGMEVAVHGVTHPLLDELPSNLCLEEILKDRENLEEQFDVVVRGMAYPCGTFNDQVVDAARMAGIAYARTVISTENFEIPTDWLRMRATCHHDNPRLMELAEQFVAHGKESWGKPWLFYLWGHSFEFEEKDNWHVIEEFAAYIGNRDDIWYATNLEVYDYVESYRKLIFGMGMKRISNPTALDICIEIDGQPYCIPAGETISTHL